MPSDSGPDLLCTSQPAARQASHAPLGVESGFHFAMGGRLFDGAQVIAALRCAEELFSAYAKTSNGSDGAFGHVPCALVDRAYHNSVDALSDEHRRAIEAACAAVNGDVDAHRRQDGHSDDGHP